MSWENTQCPCGYRKERETMLCQRCRESLKDRPELAIFEDKTQPLDFRRHAAIVLLTLVHRKRARQLLPRI